METLSYNETKFKNVFRQTRQKDHDLNFVKKN